MTIEEKRDKLQKFCDAMECCDYCRLLNFSIDCVFERFTDDCVCEAYNLAFGGEVKSDEIANPVKHGKWIDKGNAAGLFCSECNFKVRYRDERRFNYCPHCGAKMDKE